MAPNTYYPSTHIPVLICCYDSLDRKENAQYFEPLPKAKNSHKAIHIVHV